MSQQFCPFPGFLCSATEHARRGERPMRRASPESDRDGLWMAVRFSPASSAPPFPLVEAGLQPGSSSFCHPACPDPVGDRRGLFCRWVCRGAQYIAPSFFAPVAPSRNLSRLPRASRGPGREGAILLSSCALAPVAAADRRGLFCRWVCRGRALARLFFLSCRRPPVGDRSATSSSCSALCGSERRLSRLPRKMLRGLPSGAPT
jgi:hypothetical protein